jgi:2-dehydro-3-deoxygalactonokinase
MAPSGLICLDWGTSSLRAWLLNNQGEVVGEVANDRGILNVPLAEFETVFVQSVGDWLARDPKYPILASGMITSKNGWIETPYVECPAGIQALADGLVRGRAGESTGIHFVPGVAQNTADGLPDVMRGEETEIIGQLSMSQQGDGVFVLPGTHSKWVSVNNYQIVQFQTFMTGEIYSVLKHNSIIGRLLKEGPFVEERFCEGVRNSLVAGGSILGRLFSARSLVLFDRLHATDIGDYLSGLLIGDEIRASASAASVTVIGRGDLAERYLIALKLAGVDARVAPSGAARRGLFAIARAAGLI